MNEATSRFASRDRLAPRLAELARKLEDPSPLVIWAVREELITLSRFDERVKHQPVANLE